MLKCFMCVHRPTSKMFGALLGSLEKTHTHTCILLRHKSPMELVETCFSSPSIPRTSKKQINMVFYSSVISSWESHQSSTCHLPSHGLPWPFGGVVPPLLSTSNCFRVLWSHPYFNIKEVWFLPIGNKALLLGKPLEAVENAGWSHRSRFRLQHRFCLTQLPSILGSPQHDYHGMNYGIPIFGRPLPWGNEPRFMYSASGDGNRYQLAFLGTKRFWFEDVWST